MSRFHARMVAKGSFKTEASIQNTYEILEPIGQGGFGVVYKAKQRTTGQLVAIKTVLPGLDDDRSATVVARFLRETQLCAQLFHPNIVQLIDAGETPSGQLYTVFAYVPGKSLNRVLADEGALDPEEAKHLMLQVLDALACAHDQGIIHRDIKPANIMVISTSARRSALVLDFGISSVVKGTGSTDYQTLTGTKEIIGTPGYAAPEQLKGLTSTPASDLFSWGLVFIECLTGKRVLVGASLEELLYKQFVDDLVPVPVSLVSHPLGTLLEQVMNKNPIARPQSAAEVVERLEGCTLRGVSRDTISGDTPVTVMPYFGTTIIQSDRTQAKKAAEKVVSERRQITVMCCNLRIRGDAKLIDIEEQNTTVIELLERCSKIVQQHQGFLAATFGEQALFFFGYPKADEQDAKRCARAALAIQADMATQGERLGHRGLQLSTRLGLHSGLVVAPSSADAVHVGLTIGMTPAISAQIANLCPPGAILVSATAQRTLRNTFRFEAGGVLHETSQPLHLFRLHGEQGSSPVLSDPVELPMLVGRESELKLLTQKWMQVQQGAGQWCLITGEPGIGKSRLAQALREDIEQHPSTLLTMRCSPDAQNSSLNPVFDLLERLIDRETEAAESTRSARLERLLLRHGLDLSTTMPLLAARLDIPLGDRYPVVESAPDQQKKQMLDALRTLLFAMAEAVPVLLLVEDLHWADPTTLEFLSQCIDQIGSVPVCMVATARPEFSQTSLSATNVSQISLSRLGSTDIEALVAEVFGGREFPEEVLKQIIRRTDGVPLFVEELAQMLIDSGVLVLRGERYGLARPLKGADIPSGLRDLLTSRLDRLGKAKETAQLAATIGRDFGLALLSATSDNSPEQIQADLDKLQAAGLIQPKRKKDDKGYVFKHALIRDAAYESLPLQARRKIHARVARTLEESFASIVAARPDLLARHHAAAEQKQQAIGYARNCATLALQRSAYAEAMAEINQALGWLDAIQDGTERMSVELELNLLLMPALMASIGYGDPKVEALTNRIFKLSDALGKSPHTFFSTLYALTTYHHLQSNRKKALELAERLVGLAKESQDSAQDLAAHAILAQCYIMAGKLDDGRKAAEHSVAVHDPVRHRDMALKYGVDLKTFAHLMLGQALAYLGYLDRAVVEFGHAIDWSRELNQPDMLSLSLFFSAYAYRIRRESQRILDVTDEAIAVAERYDLPFAKPYALLLRGCVTQDVAQLSRVIQSHKAAGQRAGTPFLVSILAEAEAASGQFADAIAHIDEALQFSEQHADVWFLSACLRLKGTFLLMQDPLATESAEAYFRRAIDVARQQQAKIEELDATVELAKLLRQRGRQAEGHEMLAKVYGWFTEGLDTLPLKDAQNLLEQLARQSTMKGH